jgi:hypothetical protein
MLDSMREHRRIGKYDMKIYEEDGDKQEGASEEMVATRCSCNINGSILRGFSQMPEDGNSRLPHVDSKSTYKRADTRSKE